MTASTNTAIFRTLLAIVVLAPLPLGGNRPWAAALLAALIALTALAWTCSVLAGTVRATAPPQRVWIPAALFSSALLWAVLQTLSVTPNDAWHPLWNEAAAALGANLGAVSVAPKAGWDAVMRLAAYAAVFLLASQLAVERARAHEAMRAVVIAAAIYASYGLFIYFTGAETILWLPKWAYLGDLTATFVNRNTYGAYAGLGLVCAVAMFAHRLRQPKNQQRGAAEWTETFLLRAMPYLLVALLAGSALLLSHSRGAFLSTGLALVVLLSALTLARSLPPQTALRISIVIAAVAIAVIAVSGETTLQRLLETGNPAADEGRPEVYRLAIDAIADAPLAGHGLGAFQSAFRTYRSVDLPSPEDWKYAHNLYLETAMDLGIPAATALFAAIAAIIASCAKGLYRRRRDHVYPATAIAVATLIATHNAIDFSAQIPAVAITFALILGLGFAQAWSAKIQNNASLND